MKRILIVCLLAFAGCAGAEDADATTDDAGVITVDQLPSQTVAPAPICMGSEVWCGASCENLQTSLGSCGVCNLHCPHNMTCVKGVCTER